MLQATRCATPIIEDNEDGALLDPHAFRAWATEVSAVLDQCGLDAVECEMTALAELGRSIAPTAADVLTDPLESPTARARAFLRLTMALDRLLSVA